MILIAVFVQATAQPVKVVLDTQLFHQTQNVCVLHNNKLTPAAFKEDLDHLDINYAAHETESIEQKQD